jgi:two-component system, LytTR family, response regulator
MTKMITCIAIDDEKRALETFQKMADRYFPTRLKVIGLASSVRDGAKLIKEVNPDVVFLDIEMPVENGFKLFEYFEEITFVVVFLTAYKHYAIDAIRYSAFDYLLKPLDVEDLGRVVNRFEKNHPGNQQTERIHTLLSNINAASEIQNKIALPTLSGYRMERIDNIVYCQADENYTQIYTSSGESILVSRTLKAVEELLPAAYFYRIHKSYLVNLNFVKEYTRAEGHHIHLDNGVKLEVATRRQDEFMKLLTHRKT